MVYSFSTVFHQPIQSLALNRGWYHREVEYEIREASSKLLPLEMDIHRKKVEFAIICH